MYRQCSVLLPMRVLWTLYYTSIVLPSLPRPHQILQSLHHQHCANTSVDCFSLLPSLDEKNTLVNLTIILLLHSTVDEGRIIFSCYSPNSAYQISHHTKILQKYWSPPSTFLQGLLTPLVRVYSFLNTHELTSHCCPKTPLFKPTKY